MAKSSQKAVQGKLIIGLLRFFSWWSLPVNHRFGAVMGWLLWKLPSQPKRISKINIELAFPYLSENQQQQLLKKSLMELGKTTTELGALWCWPTDKILKKIQGVSGESYIKEAFAQGQGVMVLSPHIGCWEVVGLYLAQNYPMTILYRPPNIPYMESFMTKVRQRAGATLVPTDLTGVKRLRQALRKNELIGILPDQDPGASGGVYAPFFNHPARTMVLVSKLAAKSNCRVLTIVAERLPDGQGYYLHITPAEADVANTDEAIATTALNRSVEKCAKRFSTQYQWNYKRYKHPPKGTADVYKF
ncbi:MAG: lipid A biosynthesis acyltransferase [Piscirickettsiaceae bacterium CG_4_9_14_3_um_filter_43_564]|nr:lysophospholipid acyltransferase family protein [Thiomicrospira sp.]OIP95328.1 MAG: lipid A biosynthesis acyltransferase [Thiomicrospira sp. CG2_30_44_34]PIQ02933.1 MAG: lipid A biosynthesis acyltransferase [Piscirickettsiaceae bacterium CG18_big_fil_WC_8_21_14_2_50_44_103]PIU38964.1 MAG: lipid A biosynthesis acyltransferase [Piscirickettsiaceae bacterium CG07_land_8_20_14_0_80_44_28]PIW57485.1 MAG: lipid A biosynthesis acyltransferase [Piscirickettsiaceae bacterium CG12_big_fil_rev_8_21_14_